MFELPEEKLTEAVDFVRKCMETKPFKDFDLPLVAEAAVGTRFGSLKEMEGGQRASVAESPQTYSHRAIGEKVLVHEAYEDLIQNLNEENEFVKEITNECGEEKDRTARCYLFHDETRNDEALAINAEGYDYARYAALIRL